MAAITKSTIFSSANDNIFNVINTRSNVSDPTSGGTSTARQFVYQTDPLVKDTNFTGYPCVIALFPRIDQTNPTVNGKGKMLGWVQEIIVRTLKDGKSNSNLGVGITDMKSIVDDLIETFNSETIKQALRLLGVRNVNLLVTGNDSVSIHDNELLETVFELTYKTRFQVSS